MEIRDLTLKDMEGIETKGKSLFGVLVAAAERAKHVLEEQDAAQGQERERKRERPAMRIASSAAADATAAEREKCDAPNNKRNIMGHGPQPPPPLPQEFKNAIQEIAQGMNISREKLVIQKGLYKTDLSKNHNRLSIPINQISDDFLTDEEKRYLCKHNGNHKRNYIEVMIIEPSLERDVVKLCKWDMPKQNGKTSFCYVINGTWKPIAGRNGLEHGAVVQLWSFRIEEDLCFALVRVC